MIDFEKILEYQKLNIALSRLDREYEKLDDKKKLDVVRHKYNDLQNTVISGESEAETLISEVNAINEEYASLMAAFEELSVKIKNAVTEEDKLKFMPQLESIKAKLENADRKLNQKIKKCKEIVSISAKAQESKKTVKGNYDSIKKRLDVYRAEKAPERKEIETKMEKLESEVDKPLLERYKKIRSEGILPVIVKAVGDANNYSCYCGLGLSQAKKGELIDKKTCQCESCRRLIFID